MSRTLCIFKPDLAGDLTNTAQALQRLLAIYLIPSRLERLTMTSEQAQCLYAEHEGAAHYARNIEFVTSGPCLVMILEGVRAVERLREITGATDPKKAMTGTLRRMFGTELPKNAVHASASAQEAEDEIKIFFSEEK